MKTVLSIVLCVFLVFGSVLASAAIIPVEDESAYRIEFDPDTIEIFAKSKLKLEPKVIFHNEAYSKPIKMKWSSSDSSVAKVYYGVVTGVSAGTAQITCISDENPEISANLTVSVVAHVFKIVANEQKITLMLGAPVGMKNQFRPEYAIQPSNAKYQEVSWSSANPAVALVDESGMITAVSPGYARITAVSEEPNAKKPASCSWMVKVVQAVHSLSDPETEILLEKGRIRALKPHALPKDADNRTLRWETSDPKVVKVKNGTLSAVGGGNATVTCTAADGGGASLSYSVSVTVPCKKLAFSSKEIALRAGETLDLTELLVSTPIDATLPTILWSSSDIGVATVDPQGTVTAVAPGTCTLLINTGNGSQLKASVSLTVTEEES